MTLLIIVLFLVLLVLGMDVGFAMVLAAVAGILTRPDAYNDAVMLPLTVALATSKEALVELVKLLALAVNCLPVPAVLTLSPAKLTMPLPALVPISSAGVPRSKPLLTLRLTNLLLPSPTTESLPNGSCVFTTGVGGVLPHQLPNASVWLLNVDVPQFRFVVWLAAPGAKFGSVGLKLLGV
jgi:hypothetical protein